MKNALTYDNTTFDNDALRSVQMNIDTSLSGRVLDVDTIVAVVDTKSADTPGYLISADDFYLITADDFQLTADAGTSAPDGLAQDTPVRFLRGGSQYSLWYRDVVRRIGPTLYELSMISSLGRLSQMPHKGGVYNGVPAEDIIDEICGVVPHYIDPVFAATLIYGWLPYVAPSGEAGVKQGSAKDNLMLVLFALNATVRDDANGTLRIENLSTAVSSIIDDDKIYRDSASVEYETPVTAVTVLEHQYIVGTESVTLFDGTTSANQIIVFDEPMSSVTGTGITILTAEANYCIVGAGTGIIEGVPYIHTTREITRAVSVASVPNVVRIEDATLVSITNSADVADRLADYYAHRTRIKVDALIDYEDAGDVVQIYDPFDKVMRSATIESIYGINASNVMKGSVDALVGFTPWQVEPFIDKRVLLTGSGTWTVPAGVTQVTAVLIGGGSGGDGGVDGENGETGEPSSVTVVYPQPSGSAPFAFSNGAGGEGGQGGTGGRGGTILRVDATVEGGDTFSFVCGSNGTGGAGNGGEGTEGADTTFGIFSSADGSISPSGYTEIWNGVTTVFGAAGADGYTGGNGGNGGRTSSTSSGEAGAGGEVAGYTGGEGGGNYDFTGGTPIGSNYAHQAGGGGGGAAYGMNGTDGNNGESGAFYDLVVHGGEGGVGGNGDAGANAVNYGNGGGGGHGGGGGGGGGGNSYRGENTRPPYTVTYYNARYGGDGGTGGAGGDGAPGCILLYYREPA